jgi:hypothetical protein
MTTGQGGEAVRVTGNDFTLADLALEDAPGVDLFRAQGVDGLHSARAPSGLRVRRQRRTAPTASPVACKDVLMEDSTAIGASDTGFYVGSRAT